MYFTCMMDLPKKKRRHTSKQFCPHCEKKVSTSTWYRHYSQFYDPSTNGWEKGVSVGNSELDFSFGSDESDTETPVPTTVEESGASSLDMDDPEMDSAIEAEEDIEVWDSSDDEENESASASSIDVSTLNIINFVCIFLLAWQAVFRVTNSAMGLLFKFIGMLFKKLAEITRCQRIHALCELFPDTLLKAQTMQSIKCNSFQKLIVCPKCHSTYEESEFIGEKEIPRCSYVRFSRHPQQRMRMKCGELLLKKVKISSKKTIFAPIKVFCYRSLIDLIGNFLQRPGIIDLFNHWRNREIPEGIMADLYDAAVWKSFLSINGENLLSDRYSVGLLINVDWFQPYKHIPYSVGAIYVSILNFPRKMRNLRDNILLIGIIPGPNEPKLHMNSFLELLVKDLMKLRRGVQMQTSEGQQLVKAVLLCCASDIPASRKMCGFMGHAAARGCSRCLKVFPTEHFGDKTYYGGFDRSLWPERTVEQHREKGMSWKHSTTLTSRQKIEREHGVRFTELLRLEYFDTIHFVVVDPMHNMLLGTAKRMLTIWKGMGLLPETECDQIQTSVDKFITPADIGRIPHKIASQFTGFTADQWKNWTLIYSTILLKPILPVNHYRCWCLFVEACRLLCSRAISHDGLEKMDSCIIRFCKTYEELYGALSCTPNLHLHCHLKQCFQDFGPAGSFWAFPFERLNGILGSVPTNHHAIEIQLMRKFCTNQQAVHALNNSESSLQELFQAFVTSKGSLRHSEIPELPLLSPLSVSNIEAHCKSCTLVPPIKEACFNSDEHRLIDSSLQDCFGDIYVRTMLLRKYTRAAYFLGDLCGSVNSIHSNSAMVQAKCGSNDKPCFIRKFVKGVIVLKPMGDEQEDFYLAAINWLEEHPQKKWFDPPIEVWRKYLPCSYPESFIPVSYITCRCAYIENMIKFNRILQETVTVVVPMNNFYGLK